jgi:RimJ/RimL family protein N-acetyltransferase
MTAVQRVVLTPLVERDREPLFAWINDRDLVVFNAPFSPVSREDHDRWFDEIRAREDIRVFAIREASEDRLAGSCQLNGIDRERGSCSLQIRIADPADRGRGIGSEAIRLLVERAFDVYGLRTIRLDVFAGNERAIRAYEGAGFRRTGLRTADVVVEGRPLDVIEMELTAGGPRDDT